MICRKLNIWLVTLIMALSMAVAVMAPLAASPDDSAGMPAAIACVSEGSSGGCGGG